MRIGCKRTQQHTHKKPAYIFVVSDGRRFGQTGWRRRCQEQLNGVLGPVHIQANSLVQTVHGIGGSNSQRDSIAGERITDQTEGAFGGRVVHNCRLDIRNTRTHAHRRERMDGGAGDKPKSKAEQMNAPFARWLECGASVIIGREGPAQNGAKVANNSVASHIQCVYNNCP